MWTSHMKVVLMIGVFGVLSYDVSQRLREIGIRAAIGADRYLVMKMILWQGMQKAAIGLAIGILGTIASLRANCLM